MLADIQRDGLALWKFVANIFIVLFLLQSVASLVESDASERGRNTTCSLRLTRQKVLIQEVEDPADSGKTRRIRRRYGIDNGKGFMSPDIVVEEFRIRAKINFQARPRTRRVAHTEISNHTKTRIVSPSFRDQGIVHSHAKSMTLKTSPHFAAERSIAPSIDTLIDIEKKIVLSESIDQLPKNIIFNGTEKTEFSHDEKSPMSNCQKKSDRDRKEVGKLTKKVDIEFFSKMKKKLHQFTNDKKFSQNRGFDDGPLFGTTNAEVERPKSSSEFLVFNKESVNDNSQKMEKSGSRLRYRKSTSIVKNDRVDLDSKKKKTSFNATGEDFFDENKNLFTRKIKDFLASSKDNNLVNKIPKWYKNIRNPKKKSTDDNTSMENAKISPFFEEHEIPELRNNKLDRHRRSSVSNIQKHLSPDHIEENKRIDIHEKCHGKPPKNYTIPFASRLKKRNTNIDITSVSSFTEENKKLDQKNDRFENLTEQSVSQNPNEKSHNASDTGSILLVPLQEKKISKITKNSTIVANNNSQKKTAKQSAKNKKKKSRPENSPKKSPSKASKSSTSKTVNSTRTHTKVEKRSNNTMWNFTLPSVIGRYFAFISSLLGVSTPGNKNHALGEETNKTIAPNVDDEKTHANASATHISSGTRGENFQNITHDTNRSVPLSEVMGKTVSSNLTDENSFGNNPLTDLLTDEKEGIFQSSTKIPLENSTKIDRTILHDQNIPNTIRNPDHFSKSESTASPKNSPKAMNESNLREPFDIASKNFVKSVGSIKFGNPKKISSTNTSEIDNYSDIDISGKSAKIEDKSKKVMNFPTPTVKESSNLLIATLGKNSKNVLSSVEKNVANASDVRPEDNEEKSTRIQEFIKYTTIPASNLTKALREVASEKIAEYPEKTTLNFTIIDPNCTEPFVRNSLTNNTLDRSSSIVEVIARVSTFPTIKRYSRNDSSIDNTISTKNEDPRLHNNSAKNRQTKNSLGDYNSPNGGRRGRGGGLSRGRMRSRYKGKDQYSSIPRIGKNSWRRNNYSATPNLSTSPHSSNRPGNLVGSVLSRENLKSPVKPLFGRFSDLSISSSSNADHNKINASAIEEMIFHGISTLSVPTRIATNGIYRSTGTTPSTVDDLSKEANKSENKYSKKKEEPSTVSSTNEFSMIDTIRIYPTFTRAEEGREKDRIAQKEILMKKKLSNVSSTIPYDKSISGESSMSTILLRNNLIASSNRTDGDAAMNIEGSSNELQTVHSIKEDTKESSVGEKIFEISPTTKPSLVTSETKRHRDSRVDIDDNTASNKSTTNSYEKLSFVDSTSFNEISSATEKTIAFSESPPITENEILPGARNTQTTVDEPVRRDNVRDFVSDSMENRNVASYTTEEKSKFPPVTRNVMELKYSTTPPHENNEPDDSSVKTRKLTEILLTKLTEIPQIRDNNFSTERDFPIEKMLSPNDSRMTIYGGSNSHETVGLPESPVSSSMRLKNKTDVNYNSITSYPDSAGREFFEKEEHVIVPGDESSTSVSSSNVVRKARDSRAISDYDDRRELEFDYDIDASAEIEPATERTMISREDNAEKRSSDPGKLRNALIPYRHEAHRNIHGPRDLSTKGDATGSTDTRIENSRGIPTPKSSTMIIGLPHSAVHEVFFENGEAGLGGDSESTVIPTNRRFLDDQSVRASTARLADNFDDPYGFPETPGNLTNFLDESKLLEFVESLEDFLFDDSVTGTSDRKPLSSSDQDLLAESTNSIAETRSAIFKTRKFSAQNNKIKNGKNTKRSGNERSKKVNSIRFGKKEPIRSTTKKNSNFSPIGRKNQSKSAKKKIVKGAEKKMNRDKLKDKFRQVKISKTLMDFNSRRKGVKEQNSTDKVSAKKRAK